MTPTDHGGQGEGRANLICHSLEIAAPPNTVFSAVTSVEGLSRWWTTQVSGDPARAGGLIRFAFRGPFNPVMRVTGFDPPARVEWQGTTGHEAWGSWTGIEFRIFPVDNGTRVRFQHALGPETDEEGTASANFNWGYYLDSLRTYCEAGTGKPFQPDNPRARVAASAIA